MKYAIAKADGSHAYMTTLPGIDPAGEIEGWSEQHKLLLSWPLDIREVSEWVQESSISPEIAFATADPDIRDAVIGLAAIASEERQKATDMEARLRALEETISALRGAV